MIFTTVNTLYAFSSYISTVFCDIALFNPNDSSDETKISHLIQQNFLGKALSDLSAFGEHRDLITYTNVQDILDFSRKDFNKAFSLSPKKNIAIETKWELVKLGDIVVTNPSKTEISKLDEKTLISFVEMSSVSNGGYIENKTDKSIKELKKRGFTYFKENDIIIAKITPCMENGKCAIAKGLTNKVGLGSTEFHVLRAPREIEVEFLFSLLNRKLIRDEAEKQMTGSSGHRRVPIEFYENIKIPLPPKNIQQMIVIECEAIDKASEQGQAMIDKATLEIEKGFNEASSKPTKILRLNNADMFEVSIGKRVVAKEIEETKNGIPVYSANVFEPFGYINKQLLKDFDRPSVLWGIDGDWMVSHVERNKPFYPTDHCGVLRIKGDEIHYRYLTWVLNKAGEEVRFSRNHRASIDRIKGLSVQVPSMDIQKSLFAKVEKLEAKINQAQAVLDGATQQKQEIMDKYLK